MLATRVQRARTEADHPRHGALVAKPLADLLRLFKERQRQIGSGTIRSGLAGLLQHGGAVLVAVGDLDRLLEIRHGLERGSEGDGPVGGSPQGDPRLARERLGFGAVRRGPVRRQVVGSQARRRARRRRATRSSAPPRGAGRAGRAARGSSRRPRG